MKFNLACATCTRTFIIEGNNPLPDSLVVCPACASQDIKVSKELFDYWDEVSNSSGIPKDIIKYLFSIWDMKEYPNFVEFIYTMIEDEDIRLKFNKKPK